MFKKLAVLGFGLAALAFALVVAGCANCRHAERDRQITGITWQLDLSSLKGVQNPSEKPMRPITLLIAADGKVSGCAGVNRYFGTAVVDEAEEDLKFPPLGTTRMAGPGMNYETAYLQMLAKVEEYKITGDLLTLYGDDDVRLAQYVKAKITE